MVGITVQTSHRNNTDDIRNGIEGLWLYKDNRRIFVDKIEAAHIAKTVKEARRKYWKRFKLASLKEV